ncbi:MAG: cyclic lactone autoinducer peptide [Lachnospiraceae bacterium]|nr:cyclic lactone autoinducer peptide [Lachnospiraceae bacterium]
MKKKLFQTVASFALLMTAISTYGYCYFVMYQEDVPEAAKKMLKDR